MLAAVVIATVPEPWINLIAVEIKRGRITTGIAVVARPSAMKLPRPESEITLPRAPPPPVRRRMIPAEAIPFSISSRASCLVMFVARVKIEIIRPTARANIGWPMNSQTTPAVPSIPRALDTVATRISKIGTISGANETTAEGMLSKSTAKSAE